MRFTKCCASVCTFIGVLIMVAIGARAQQTTVGNGNSLQPLPHALETELELSALPPYLRANATVYVLDPATGYVSERKGTNGFTCFVERTDWVREDFRNDLLIPECFDAEGTKTIVPVSFDVARLRAVGKVSPQELKREITQKFRGGVYHSPARPGVSYMLSPIQRLYGGPESRETRTLNMPHYMFYAPNLTKEYIGGGPVMGRYPYLVNPGPHAYLIVNVGETEKAQINQEESDLLKEVCAYRSDFCMDGVSAKGQAH